MSFLKRIAAQLPEVWQDDLKRLHFRRLLRGNRFKSEEPEYDLLSDLISPGDWAIDVGANIGHYTKRLSDLVGPSGRVIALEPITSTFSLLAANARMFSNHNVTLLNAAASSQSRLHTMNIPRFSSGLKNYYQAHITADRSTQLHSTEILALRLDSLELSGRIRLVKIDAEGHEAEVIRGMEGLLQANRPHLIVEGISEEVDSMLRNHRYTPERLAHSPNSLFRAN